MGIPKFNHTGIEPVYVFIRGMGMVY
jgi:hypothetical protein